MGWAAIFAASTTRITRQRLSLDKGRVSMISTLSPTLHSFFSSWAWSTVRRSNRKTLIGFVATRSGDKSVKVNFQYTVLHPVYGKEVKRRTVLHAHDEKNECKVGDKVEIMETRPLSKLKRWRVIRVVEAAKIAAQPIDG